MGVVGGRRGALAAAGLVALCGAAALAVTWPDAGAGVWIDYAVPLAAIALFIAVARPLDGGPLTFAARLVVGSVWLYAGWLKIGDPAASIAAVRAYDLLPGTLVETLGYLLPPLEMVLGAALILGLMTRGAALLTALLTTAFIIGIASAWARGLTIDCGCFGSGGVKADAHLAYPWELTRDVALLLLSGYLVAARHRWLAADNILFRPVAVEWDESDDTDVLDEHVERETQP